MRFRLEAGHCGYAGTCQKQVLAKVLEPEPYSTRRVMPVRRVPVGFPVFDFELSSLFQCPDNSDNLSVR